MSDGEVTERLWSYLRRFSRMTKEMRPAHRTDILCHVLLYYGSKTKQKLGNDMGILMGGLNDPRFYIIERYTPVTTLEEN